jgi:hypothetical protein
MLWKLTTTNKYGNLRSRIVHSDGALTIGQGFGPFVGVNYFVTNHVHHIMVL